MIIALLMVGAIMYHAGYCAGKNKVFQDYNIRVK